MLHITVTLSIILGFVLSEFAGILTGGLISAGYLAFYVDNPTRLIATMVLSFVICLIVKGLKHVMILYGRRKYILTVLLSIVCVFLVERSYHLFPTATVDFRIIGFIVPGLVANDMDKQGVLKTILALCAVVAVLRLVIMLGLC